MPNNTVISSSETPDQGSSGKFRQRQKASLRLNLLDTASRMVAEGGAESLSLRKLAEEVGASTMVVYTTFGSKEGLLNELWREGFRRLWETEEEALKQADPLARLHALGKAYRQNAITNPYFYKLVFGGQLPTAQLSKEMESDECNRTFTVLVQAVADCQKAGLIAGDLPEVDVAAMFWSTAHGAISLELSGMLGKWACAETIYTLNFENLLRGLK